LGKCSTLAWTQKKTGRIAVAISVDDEFKISKNTTGILYNMDIMGSKAIRLELAEDTLFARNKDTLMAHFEAGTMDKLQQEVGPIKEEAMQITGQIDTLLYSMNQILRDQNRIILEQSLNEFNRSLPIILNNIAAITANLKNSNSDIKNITGNLSSVTDSLQKADLAKTIRQLDSMTMALNKTIKKIESGQGTAGKLIHDDSLYNNLNASTKALDDLLKDIKLNPKRYISFSAFDFGKKVFYVDGATAESEKKKKEKKK